MYRLLSIIIFFSTSLLAQPTSLDISASRWIMKVSSADYNTKFGSTKSVDGIELRKISDHFNLINVISKNLHSESEIRNMFAGLEILELNPDSKLEQRDLIPDDFKYENQWSMEMINMPAVWEHTVGGVNSNGEEIVVAVLDVGYQIDHIDLVENIWINKNETPDNDTDDDGNGYKDDYRGLNIVTQNDSHIIKDHGTKVAGIIGAEGNNGRGVAGVNWNVKILPISGVEHVGDIIFAMRYVVMMKQKYISSNGAEGANIVATNLSAGVKKVFPEAHADWCPYYDLAGQLGILSVGAAPNDFYNVDEEGDLPSLCQSDYLIAVTNTDIDDLKVSAAAIGPKNIDLGAPGERIFTTTLGDDYALISGTSGSAPHVAGLVALFHSLECVKLSDLVTSDPQAAALLIKDAILNGVDSNQEMSQTVSGGRLNAYNSFLNLAGWCTGFELGTLEVQDVHVDQTRLDVRYSTDEFSRHKISLYNMLGQLIKQEEFQPTVFDEKVLRINLEDLSLAPGHYVVSLSNEEGVASSVLAYIF